MTKAEPSHITVCICTYKRPTLLRDLLTALQNQKTDGAFTYSIVVVDNDRDDSAHAVVAACARTAAVPIDYYRQPQKNIALTRNEAVERARGDFVAFIDDDEIPIDEWLYNLHATCCQHQADAVLGPVRPKFESDPPRWILRTQLLERPSYPTGTVLRWSDTRTGNVLLRTSVFKGSGNRFRPEFRHSEDQDFFKRIIEQGCLVLWCAEASVYEVQRAERFSIMYFLKRALLRGNVSLKLQSYKLRFILKSAAAVLIYTVSLPILLVVRRDLFIAYLIKDCDHIGRLLAACRVDIQEYLA